ncbi:MAG: glycosyltransferase family 2 protein [Limosilactobacillus mucosae]
MIKYSMIVPAYNAEKYLDDCIESVLGQQRDDVELIIVNDGSTDNTYDICKKYSNVVFINKKNTGSMDSYITGIKKSKGEYIGFIDSDDCIESDYFSTLDKAIAFDKSVDIVMFDYNRYSTLGKRKNKVNDIPYGRLSGALLDELKKDYFSIYEKFSFYRWNKIYKNSLIKESVDEIDFRATYFEDLYIGMLTLLKSTNILYIDNCLYNYRLRKSSVTHSVSLKVFSDNRLLKSKLNILFNNMNESTTAITNMEEYMDYGYVRYYLRSKEKPYRIKIPMHIILNNMHKDHNKLLLIYKFRLGWLFRIAYILKKSFSKNNYFFE